MDRKLLIFGASEIAELAAFYFEKDLNRRTEAFVLDDEYVDSDKAFNKPLIKSSMVKQLFNPLETDIFVALSYAKMNSLRQRVVAWVEENGFGLTSYISPKACVFSNVAIGQNAFILENNVVQPFVKIGKNVTLWSGNHIGHHSSIKDNVFIASHVVISGGVQVGENSFLGVNSTIRDHVNIGHHSLISAAASVMKDTEPESVLLGAKSTVHTLKSHEIKGM